MAKYCDICKEKIPLMSSVNLDGKTICFTCSSKIQEEKEKKFKEEVKNREEQIKIQKERIEVASKEVLVVSVPMIEGKKIVKYFNIISSEVTIGTGLFTEIASEIVDMLGTTSNAIEEKINKAKNLAIDKIKYKAALLGANAVIGAEVEYTVNDKNMIMYSVCGTPVILKNSQNNE